MPSEARMEIHPDWEAAQRYARQVLQEHGPMGLEIMLCELRQAAESG